MFNIEMLTEYCICLQRYEEEHRHIPNPTRRRKLRG